MPHNALTLRLMGYLGSLLLTLAAFYIIANADSLHWKVGVAILILFVFAVLQFIVQFVFFLDLWREKGPRWNLFVFFFDDVDYTHYYFSVDLDHGPSQLQYDAYA